MKKLLMMCLFSALFISGVSAQEFKVITSVESVVPMGLGRSRFIAQQDSLNIEEFTTSRVDGKAQKKKKGTRSELKIDKMDETTMLNFYSAVGINFQNIGSNDALITSMLNKMAREGWDLIFVTSGVESDAGKGDGTGIYITRYIFRR